MRYLRDLRGRRFPEAEAQGLSISWGGSSAVMADFDAELFGCLPRVVAAVVLITFVVLALLFRSLLIPLKATALEHRVGAGRLRLPGAGVPGRLGRARDWPRPAGRPQLVHRADAVHDPVRALDGLRGVPRWRASARSTCATATTIARSRKAWRAPAASSPARRSSWSRSSPHSGSRAWWRPGSSGWAWRSRWRSTRR